MHLGPGCLGTAATDTGRNERPLASRSELLRTASAHLEKEEEGEEEGEREAKAHSTVTAAAFHRHPLADGLGMDDRELASIGLIIPAAVGQPVIPNLHTVERVAQARDIDQDPRPNGGKNQLIPRPEKTAVSGQATLHESSGCGQLRRCDGALAIRMPLSCITSKTLESNLDLVACSSRQTSAEVTTLNFSKPLGLRPSLDAFQDENLPRNGVDGRAISPLEYTRAYLLEKARSERDGPINLPPPPDTHWCWAQNREDLSIHLRESSSPTATQFSSLIQHSSPAQNPSWGKGPHQQPSTQSSVHHTSANKY